MTAHVGRKRQCLPTLPFDLVTALGGTSRSVDTGHHQHQIVEIAGVDMYRRRIAQAHDRMPRPLQRRQIGADAAVATQEHSRTMSLPAVIPVTRTLPLYGRVQPNSMYRRGAPTKCVFENRIALRKSDSACLIGAF